MMAATGHSIYRLGSRILIGDKPVRSEEVKELFLLLAKGEDEIAAGKGYDLEAVLKEADVLLAEEPVVPT